MPPGGQGGRRAAAGEAGAADFPEHERVPQDGVSATRCLRLRQRLGRATFCRAGFAGRGTAFARSTERPTLASDPDPRRSLGSAP